MSDFIQSLPGLAGNKSSAAAADVVITYDHEGGIKHIITGLAWSYDIAPNGGRLTVEDGGGTIVFDIDITADGPGSIHFDPNVRGSENTDLICTLYSGGAGCTGKLNVLGHYTQGVAT
jgi:hypothetical protein